jgi:hypothetical protein
VGHPASEHFYNMTNIGLNICCATSAGRSSDVEEFRENLN